MFDILNDIHAIYQIMKFAIILRCCSTTDRMSSHTRKIRFIVFDLRATFVVYSQPAKVLLQHSNVSTLQVHSFQMAHFRRSVNVVEPQPRPRPLTRIEHFIERNRHHKITFHYAFRQIPDLI